MNSAASIPISQIKAKKRYRRLILLGILTFMVMTLWSLCHGNYPTTITDVVSALLHPDEHESVYRIVTLSRIPRLIASVFVGAALSVSGLVAQELYHNRMASPDILGVSAGAGVGASAAILYGLGFVATSILAFAGGLVAVLLTTVVSLLFGNRNNRSVTMILSGIVIGGVMNSCLGFMKYWSNDAQLSSITFWMLGGFYNTTYRQLAIACPAIFAGLVFLFLFRWKISMLKGGHSDAATHGINDALLRKVTIATTTVITALSVCISGTIGWIGLAIPNLVRLLVHNDSKQLFPITLLYGIAFTEICDYLARTLTPTEIPVGIISGVLGGFLFLLVLTIQKVQVKHDSDA